MPSGGVTVALGASNRKTWTPLTRVYGENSPATSPTVSWPVPVAMPWTVDTAV